MAGLYQYADSDIVNDTQRLVTSTWANNTNNLTTQFTSSQVAYGSATASGAHYINVYNSVANATGSSNVQYSIAYGHRHGSGSLDFTNDVGAYGKSPSANIYSQYRQLVYGDENSFFSFNGHTPESIFVININRSRYKHNLKPGTLNLKISGSGNNFLFLTDDSLTTTGSSVVTNAGRQFNVVSGSDGVMLGTSLNQLQGGGSGSYGLFYPDSGFMVLNADAIRDSRFGLNGADSLTEITASNTDGQNARRLFDCISGNPDGFNAQGTGDTLGGNYFIIDSEEKVSSQYYFTRAKNNEFNYTTNPSYVDQQGNVSFTSMIDNPTTYITTVGLYNDSGDLVAVAKLSQPVVKDFTKEALIRVKLDY